MLRIKRQQYACDMPSSKQATKQVRCARKKQREGGEPTRKLPICTHVVHCRLQSTRREAGLLHGGHDMQGCSLVRHEEELVSLPDDASLALAHGNGAHVLILVNDGHPEGGQGISRQGVCVVQDLKEGPPLVPGASLWVHCLHDVVP